MDKPTHLQLALPFFLTAAITLVNTCLVLLVVDAAERYFKTILDDAHFPEERRGSALQPSDLAGSIGNWMIDAGSLFSGACGPLVGFVLLLDKINTSAFDLIYASVFFVSLAAFAMFVSMVKPGGYSRRTIGRQVEALHRRVGIPAIWFVTPANVGIIGLNLLGAAAILVFGS